MFSSPAAAVQRLGEEVGDGEEDEEDREAEAKADAKG